MDYVNKNICIFCLPKVHNVDLDIIDNDKKYMMQVLDLNLDLDLCEEPKICGECTADLQRSFEFKSICLKTEKRLSPFITSEENFYLNLSVVYLKENQVAKLIKSLSKPHKVCRFCLQITDDSNYIYLKESKVNLFISDILHRHFSEVNLNISEDPIACLTCRDSLRRISIFISNCSRVEQQINEYIRMEGLNSRGFVDLNNVLNHFLKSRLINMVKIESQYQEMQENGIEFVEVKTENFADADNSEANIKKEDTGTDSELTTNESITFIQQQISTKLYKCSVCPYATKDKKYFQKHTLCHKADQEITPYKCENGNFSRKYRINFNFRTVTRTDASEITMLVCQLCSFVTKYKQSLKTHMILHEGSTDALKYVCKMCNFKTNTRYVYRQHRLTHKPTYKDPFKVTMYKCQICAFKTIHKASLKRHVMGHQRKPETGICEVCAYTSKNKTAFNNHILRHKEQLKTTMHKLYT